MKKMLNTKELLGYIEFEELFEKYTSYLKLQIKNKILDEKFLNNSSFLYWTIFTQLFLQSKTINVFNKNDNENKLLFDFYEQSLIILNDENKLNHFLKIFLNKLDISYLISNFSFKKKLISFYYKNSNWFLEDLNRFLLALKFIQFSDEQLIHLVEYIFQIYSFLLKTNFKSLSENEFKIWKDFWNSLAKYQLLSNIFIQKYYKNFLYPEFAFNLIKGNNQFYNCHFYIIAKIKKKVNEFLNN